MATSETTLFSTIYDAFYNTVTDDMYLEWSPSETAQDLNNILLDAIPNFEFPRFKLFDYQETTTGSGIYQYNVALTKEEIEILANLMVLEWIKRQILTVDLTRQKYSSADFALTSQANHLSKLMSLQNTFSALDRKKQRLYKRRKINEEGYIVPDYSGFGGKNAAT